MWFWWSGRASSSISIWVETMDACPKCRAACADAAADDVVATAVATATTAPATAAAAFAVAISVAACTDGCAAGSNGGPTPSWLCCPSPTSPRPLLPPPPPPPLPLAFSSTLEHRSPLIFARERRSFASKLSHAYANGRCIREDQACGYERCIWEDQTCGDSRCTREEQACGDSRCTREEQACGDGRCKGIGERLRNGNGIVKESESVLGMEMAS
jgi:hypothetical protein